MGGVIGRRSDGVWGNHSGCDQNTGQNASLEISVSIKKKKIKAGGGGGGIISLVMKQCGVKIEKGININAERIFRHTRKKT